MKLFHLFASIALFSGCVLASNPNILVFLVDDLGYGDLGCYGNHSIETPNIDRLAAEGARYTQMYAAASICTPSRAAFLTGRYPVRLGMTSNDPRFRTLNSPAQPSGIPHVEDTIAELAKEQGYRTGLVGKWHLGLGANNEYLPTAHGFDSFFGMPVTNVQTCGGKKVYNLIGGHGEILDRSYIEYWIVLTGKIWLGFIVAAATTWFFYSRKLAFVILGIAVFGFLIGMWYSLSFTLLSRSSCLLYRNETIIEQPVHLNDLTLRNTNEAIRFMTESVEEHKKPFFLFMAYVKVHTALFTLPENAGRSRHGAYGDNVEELDWSVGRVMEALQTLGVANDTLILFSSDNGPFLERGIEAGFCGRAKTSSGEMSGPLRGAKGQTWECGVRVPGILRWPGKIAAGQTVEEVSSLMDFLPSLLQVWDEKPKSERPLDGVSLWPNVEMNTAVSVQTASAGNRDTLFHYCGSVVTAVRQGDFKAHFWTPRWDKGMRACPSMTICPCLGDLHSPPLLFNIAADPAEDNPLNATQHEAVLTSMQEAVVKHQATLVPVPNQLETLARPWMFPCCNATGLKKFWRIVTNSCEC